MDIEQLKLILETIELLGGDTKEFAIWYLVSRLVPNVLLFIFGVVTVIASYKLLQKVCTGVIITNTIESAAWKIAKELDIRVVICWTKTDTELVLEEIRRLKSNQK